MVLRRTGQPHAAGYQRCLGKISLCRRQSGAYSLKAEATGFYVASYDFVLRAPQPLSLTVEVQAKESVQQTVEVKAGYRTIPKRPALEPVDPAGPGEPDPLTDTTNDLVNNLVPRASDSHANFLAVRGTEFSLHEFINGVSFLDHTQPQFARA